MSDLPVDAQLQDYRASIDNIDAALVHLLAEQFKITKAVGRYKATADMPRPTPNTRRSRSPGCGHWRRSRASIRCSRRSSCVSSWPRSSTTINASQRANRSERRRQRRSGCDRRLDHVGEIRRRHGGGTQRGRRPPRVGRQHAGVPPDGHRHGKPTPAEQAEVPHHCIDLVEPNSDFSVAAYQSAHSDALRAVDGAGGIPLIVGGTGLYHRAVIDEFDLRGSGRRSGRSSPRSTTRLRSTSDSRRSTRWRRRRSNRRIGVASSGRSR